MQKLLHPLFARLLSEGAFASAAHYGMATFFLTVLPLLAYPVAYLVPTLHKRGEKYREKSCDSGKICQSVVSARVSVSDSDLLVQQKTEKAFRRSAGGGNSGSGARTLDFLHTVFGLI